MVAKFREKCKTSEQALNQLTESLDQSQLDELVDINDDDDDEEDKSTVFSDDKDKGTAIIKEETIEQKESNTFFDKNNHEYKLEEPPISPEPFESQEHKIKNHTQTIESYEEVEYLEGSNQQIILANIKNNATDESIAGMDIESERQTVQYIVMDEVTDDNDIFSDIIEECNTSEIDAAASVAADKDDDEDDNTDKNIILHLLNGENKDVST